MPEQRPGRRRRDAVLTVVVADASAAQRRFVRLALGGDEQVTVVAEARSSAEAVALVLRHRPAVLVLDLDLPDRNGLGAIEQIMAAAPTPIVVRSARVRGTTPDGRANGSLALAAGAVDVLPKPADGEIDPAGEHASALRARVRLAARVPVITHPRARLAEGARGAGTRGAAVELVVIGASTGGPGALAALLGALPVGFPAAVLVVQHMAQGFLEGLADWLHATGPLPVAVGTGGQTLRPGTVTLAPDALNAVVSAGPRLHLEPASGGQRHVPGIDTAMASAGESLGCRAVGVLLTGMGADGVAGLGVLRRRGALTIAQDRETSAVYGMPAAAAEAGVVDRILPLPAIAPALVDVAAGRW